MNRKIFHVKKHSDQMLADPLSLSEAGSERLVSHCSSRREKQGSDESAGRAGEQGHPGGFIDKSCRRQGGHVEEWVQAGEDPENWREGK